MTTTISQHDIEAELIAITGKLLSEQGEPYRREIKLEYSLQRHLGIDSLSRAELFSRVEKSFSVSIPDSMLAQTETLADLVDHIKCAKPRIITSERPKIIATHGDASSVDPMQAQTLVDILLMYGEQSPNKPHIFFQNENGQEEIISYGLLLQSSLRAANGLRQRGLKPGETVAIMQPTSPKFFYTFMGILLAGGIPVPIYPPFRMHMLEAYAKTEAKILGNAEVRMLVTFDQAEKLSRLLQGFVPSLKVVVTADELLEAEAVPALPVAQSDHPAFIQYTSGSTNDPKGVLLSHYNLLSNIRAYGKAINMVSTDVAVSWLPLYHDFGLIGSWLGSFYHGTPLILMTPFTFLNHPERWLWMIHYHRGTLSGAPNFAYELCVRKVDKSMIEGLDLSSWRVAANGAEKVYPRTLDAFAKKFAPYGFKRSALMPVYGLAESTVGLVIPQGGQDYRVDVVDRKAFEEERRAVPSTGKNTLEFAGCGKPIEHHAVRIVDDAGSELPERHVGNLQFSGPSSMQGYYNNPVATRAIYHDGWYDSGDLAYQADGEFFITGRRKDLIIKAGRNLYPAEIEELVGNIPGIRQGCVAAFGVTDANRGTETLVVVAETKIKNKQQRDDLVSAINETIVTALDLPADEIVLVTPRTVPKTSSGKLQRAACKTLYLEGHLGKMRMPASLQMARLGMMWLWKKCLAAIAVLAKSVFTIYIVTMLLLTCIPVYVCTRFGSYAFAAKLVKHWARFLLRAACCPLTVNGEAYLSGNGPMIYAANHASYVDAMLGVAVVPAGTRFVVKKEVFDLPIVGMFMQKLNYISVDRVDSSKGVEDTRQIEQALKNGESVFIFPEGTFGYAAGLRPFRLGAFKIAAEAGVPVCPLAIDGARTILRDEHYLMRPARIKMTACKPRTANGVEWQDVTQLRQEVRADIAKYCGEPSLDLIAAQTVAPRLADK